MVYGRTIDGREVTFGTTGYTKDNVFVLYDRMTQSVWYPLSGRAMTAVAGPKKGMEIRFLDKPKPMALSKWRDLHPGTKILMPRRRAF